MAPMRVDDVAALLRSAAIKKRLEGVTALAEMLRAHATDALAVATDDLAALLPDVLPCLRDHNSKVASSALESLDVMLAHVPQSTVQSYFKVLWLNLVEKLGDSKLNVREKAVDVVVQLANVLDVATVFDRLLPCARHKNWRTRESTVRCLWRCLEAHDLVTKMKDDVLGLVVKLLEDSAKEVRDAAIETLEHLYARIGASLLRDLASKNIRSAQMKMLTDRFRGVQSSSGGVDALYTSTTTSATSTSAYVASSVVDSTQHAPSSSSSLTSILSSYDLPVSASSSMARYLESIRERERSASLAALGAGDGDRSPSQRSTSSDTSMTDQDALAGSGLNDSTGMSERELQRDMAAIYEQLHLDNDWSKRVDALKALQALAMRCSRNSDSVTLASFATAFKTVRERVCEQVGDLRSSVSREACGTIQTLARVLRDDFNGHADVCLGPLLKATYVTIQVISTAADTCIRGVIESTRSGFVRFISKLLEGAKSRNQVLRLHCVSYLTLTLQRWSVSHLSKHAELFLSLLPAILHDALAEVRAQSRKCFWAFQRVFPTEGDSLFERLDASTQKNLRDDRARSSASDTRAALDDASATADASGRNGMRKLKSSRSLAYDASALPSSASSTVQRVLQPSASESGSARPAAPSVSGPRRVLGASAFAETDESARVPSRVLAQGAQRVGFDTARLKASASSDDASSSSRRQTPVRPLRVLSSSDAKGPSSSSSESLFASAVGFHTSAQASGKAKRIQIAATDATPPSLFARVDQENSSEIASGDRSKRSAAVSPRPMSSSLPLAPPTLRTETSASSTASTKSTTTAAPVAAAAKAPTKPMPAPVVAVSEKLEDALAGLKSTSWSVRLDAIESLGAMIQRLVQDQQQQHPSSASTSPTVDDRLVRACVKHVSDAHYRVAQAALQSVLPLLHVARPAQVQPQLKALVPKLFQKRIETKEATRAVAQATLEYLAKTFDASTLTAVALPLLTDSSSGNMKVKAAVCHYVQRLLPAADAYMRQSSSSARTFVAKMAQLLESDLPVSVASAVGELVHVAARAYTAEVEAAVPLLPPTRRTLVTKLLRAKGVVLQAPSAAPPLSSSSSSGDKALGASTTSSRASGSSSRTQDALPIETSNNNNSHEAVETRDCAGAPGPAAERASRKRSESPNANSASPQRTIQKRKSADEGSSLVPVEARQTPAIDVWLDVLAQNNATERERRTALHKVLAFARTGGAPDVWDQHFRRLLFLLLDASAEKDVTALKVLHSLVEAQARRAHGYAHAIFQRLLESLGDRVDVASHITETILSALVRTADDPERMLAMLAPSVSSAEPPVLQVVLRLVKVALEASERSVAAAASGVSCVQDPQYIALLVAPVADRLAHASSDVRKSAVDCIVAFHFALRDDAAPLWTYLCEHVDATKRKLVEIFVERAKLERRQHASATTLSS